MADKKYKAGTTVYFSNPNGPVDQHCVPWELKLDMDELPWRVHEEKPDESLIDPVWSDKANENKGGWIEFAAKTMPQQIAQLQNNVDNLKKAQETYQQSITDTAANNNEVKQTLDKVQESQSQILDMISQVVMGSTPAPVPPVNPTNETNTDTKED